jgi:hypothetical protein
MSDAVPQMSHVRPLPRARMQSLLLGNSPPSVFAIPADGF